MAQNVALKDLEPRQLLFVTYYIESGDEKAAALQAGYSKSVADRASYHLLSLPHVAWHLANAVRKRFATSAPMAVQVIEHLARNDKIQPRVRLEAAKTLLDRAGHIAPRTADKTTETPLHEMTTDELKTLATRLEGELADRSKPVISALAAPLADEAIDLIG